METSTTPGLMRMGIGNNGWMSIRLYITDQSRAKMHPAATIAT
jgi:hypothetical protein